MYVVREELFCNAIAIKSTFGGKRHGHLWSVQRPDVYHTEAGQSWTVPTSGGMYPTFSVGATDDEKKREVAEFINRETHIKIAKLVEEILKNQLLKAVSKEYIMELHQGVLQYNGVTTSELLEHIFSNYARIDDALIIKNKRELEAPPNLSRPIDVHFCKQEECQRLAADGEIPRGAQQRRRTEQTHNRRSRPHSKRRSRQQDHRTASAWRYCRKSGRVVWHPGHGGHGKKRHNHSLHKCPTKT